jgi:phospholipid N-methyltransferase
VPRRRADGARLAFCAAAVHGAAMTNDIGRFLGQFLAAPRSVGALLPSSPALAAAMVAPIDFGTAPTVVEFGPGTGAFTAAILARMGGRGRYVGIELNPLFCRHLAARFPGTDFVEGSVADLAALMATKNISRIDAIVCGLPWASLPVALQARVFDAIGDLLADDGVFCTFAYVQGLVLPGAWALRRALRARFARVAQSAVVWRNVPPAFVYYCRQMK